MPYLKVLCPSLVLVGHITNYRVLVGLNCLTPFKLFYLRCMMVFTAALVLISACGIYHHFSCFC